MIFFFEAERGDMWITNWKIGYENENSTDNGIRMCQPNQEHF